MSIESVSSGILCKDSQIDAIAYAKDLRMYFISIGGYYWWVKDNKFPIKESDAKKLPSPFTKATAAVYIDGDAGCAVQTRSGMKSGEKEIWITDIIDGQVKMMAYDTKLGKWSSKGPINYDQDKCIAKAQIDFTSGKPIDAMFTRNYLEVYLVQGTKYAMVDCKFLCSNPDGSEFGTDSSPFSTSDFGTQDPINGMFTMDNKKLLMFHEKQYYVMTIDERLSENGKVKANKAGSGKDINTDFLKLQELPDQCSDDAPPPNEEPGPDTNSESPDVPEPDPDPLPDAGSEPEPEDESEGGSGMLWIIVAVVAIALIVIVALLAFFAMRKKSGEGQEAGMEAGAGSKVASQKSGSKVGSASGSKAGKSPSNSSLGTKSTRSSMGKSRAPASGVKSSASKK